jgi:hypothetical protein
MSRYSLLFPLGLAVLLGLPVHAETVPTASCPASITNRGAVIDSLHTLGNRLAMGRICLIGEDALLHLKQQTLNRYAGCLLTYQIKGTEIQDALEAARSVAHITWKQAKDKPGLCEQVRLATN